jgi:hypothetical protein
MARLGWTSEYGASQGDSSGEVAVLVGRLKKGSRSPPMPRRAHASAGDLDMFVTETMADAMAPLVGVRSRARGDWLGGPASSDSVKRARVRTSGWHWGPHVGASLVAGPRGEEVRLNGPRIGLWTRRVSHSFFFILSFLFYFLFFYFIFKSRIWILISQQNLYSN